MMERGVVVRYDADRGFGFVRSGAYPHGDVFVHASAISGGGPLRAGQRVRFESEPSERGPRAVRVEPGRRGLTPAVAGALAIVGVVAVVVAGFAYEQWPLPAAWLAAINAVTFALYALDKRRAGSEGRRMSERVLLGLALLGGSPGAAAAMLWTRHKTRKTAFLVPFFAILAIQAAGLGWWYWPR